MKERKKEREREREQESKRARERRIRRRSTLCIVRISRGKVREDLAAVKSFPKERRVWGFVEEIPRKLLRQKESHSCPLDELGKLSRIPLKERSRNGG